MAWQIKRNDELGLIHTTYSGAIGKQDALDATVAALSLAQGDGPHLFLSDMLDADPELLTLEISDIPDEWEALGASRANKLALVVSDRAKMWEIGQSYEAWCRGRGWNVKVFAGLQPAIDWLTAREST